MKNKKKISVYVIKANDNSSYITLITSDKTTIYINVQNTEKIANSFFEGTFYFDKLIQIDEHFQNFENNFSLYNYINYIFANNKVNFNYEDGDLNIKMKFKVNERLKEITFPLDKRNMNKEQSMTTNKILVKLVSTLQNTIKLKNEKINALRLDKNDNGNKDIKKMKIESKIINNKELKIIETQIKDIENLSSKKGKLEIQFKLLFSVNLYEQNIINQLIDFAEQNQNQCLSIIELNKQKICIFFAHKNTGNFCLLFNENEIHIIKDFYIDKDKFCFKLIGGSEKKDEINIKNYLVKEFIQMEFFNYLFINS